MLQVGVHNNVKLGEQTGFSKNEKTGNTHFKLHLQQTGEKKMFDSFMNEEEIQKNEVSLILFVPSIMEWNKTDMKDADTIAKEVQTLRNQLKAFLNVYLTEDKLKEEFSMKNMFSGLTPVTTDEEFRRNIVQEPFVNSVCNNLFHNFLEVITKNSLLTKEDTFRIKLIRSSKKSNYPALPKTKGRWIESMNVNPGTIEFTKYEIDNGWNSSEPAAANTTPIAETKSADDLFKTNGSKTPPVGGNGITGVTVDEQAPDLG